MAPRRERAPHILLHGSSFVVSARDGMTVPGDPGRSLRVHAASRALTPTAKRPPSLAKGAKPAMATGRSAWLTRKE
uniref:Uncharacterized protein n=1 Tax=Setaria italica TaxID=4555 RepID=K3ZKR9_SETIT